MSVARRLQLVKVVFAMLATSIAQGAAAQDFADVHPFIHDKFVLNAGVYFPDQDLKLRIDGSVGTQNIEWDFDERARISRDDEIFAGELTWRFGSKWSLRAQYFQESERQSVTLDEDIQWGDTTIQEGSRITLGTDFELVRAFFGRAFDSKPNHEFGVGLGVHRLKISAFFQRDITITAVETDAVAASGPLPNIGTWYYYSPSENWYFGGRLDWLQVSLGDYAGGLVNVAAGANYQIWDHVGIGLNYQLFELNADIKSDSWRGRVEKRFAGFFLYLSANW